MSEPVAPEKPDFIEKIADYAGWILAVSVAVIIAAWSLYFFQFRGGLSDDTAIWGQFGDFIGGILNSVFAFFSFMILLSSLRLQLKELRLTREELEATRKELAASSAAQKMQAEHFDRESKKKDHTEACEILEDMIFKQGHQMNIDVVGEFGFTERRSPHNGAFPKIDDKSIVKNSALEDLKSKIHLLYEFDNHLFVVSSIFSQSPIVLRSNYRYAHAFRTLCEATWIEKRKLKFFIYKERVILDTGPTK